MPRFSVLFVCLGNICRSPLGEGIFRHLAERNGGCGRYEVDSAGTGAWHIGAPPDPRSVHIAAEHEIDISRLRARRIATEDFERFSLILAMDRSNLQELRRLSPLEHKRKLHLFDAFTSGRNIDVPDPYYGDDDGFRVVYNMLFAGCESLFEKLDAERTS